MLNCCSDCTMMNAPFLESSEQLNRFFLAPLHKSRFHIFQKSKCSIHGLRPFKHKHICESCDIIPDKENKDRITVKKYILITMNCCNRRLLLPLEDDGITGDDIILVYQTHSLIGYTMKEEIGGGEVTSFSSYRCSCLVVWPIEPVRDISQGQWTCAGGTLKLTAYPSETGHPAEERTHRRCNLTDEPSV